MNKLSKLLESINNNSDQLPILNDKLKNMTFDDMYEFFNDGNNSLVQNDFIDSHVHAWMWRQELINVRRELMCFYSPMKDVNDKFKRLLTYIKNGKDISNMSIVMAKMFYVGIKKYVFANFWFSGYSQYWEMRVEIVDERNGIHHGTKKLWEIKRTDTESLLTAIKCIFQTVEDVYNIVCKTFDLKDE